MHIINKVFSSSFHIQLFCLLFSFSLFPFSSLFPFFYSLSFSILFLFAFSFFRIPKILFRKHSEKEKKQ